MAVLQKDYCRLEIRPNGFYYVEAHETQEFYYDIVPENDAGLMIRPQPGLMAADIRGFDCELHDDTISSVLLEALANNREGSVDDIANGGFEMTFMPLQWRDTHDDWLIGIELGGRYFGAWGTYLSCKLEIPATKEELLEFAYALQQEEAEMVAAV